MDLDHQRRRLEEDNKCLKAEIQKLKADTGALTRVAREARRARGLDRDPSAFSPSTLLYFLKPVSPEHLQNVLPQCHLSSL
ncbi:uncharacterized [Tachysurus ichikawai]